MFKFNSLIAVGLLVSSAPVFAGEIKNPITTGRYSCSIHLHDKSIANTYLEFSGPVLAPGAQMDQLYLGKTGIVREDEKSTQNLSGKVLSVQFVSTEELTHDHTLSIWIQNVELQSGRIVKFLSPKMTVLSAGKSKMDAVGLAWFAVEGSDECTIDCVPSGSL